MKVSSETSRRRRRYSRVAPERPCAITPAKRSILRYLAELSIASLPQLARLAALSEKAARRHCRELFDSGLIDIVPTGRVTLADPEQANDPSMLLGSAPNIYVLTRTGGKIIEQLFGEPDVASRVQHNPTSPFFLAHTLGIRDVRVWLELTARSYQNHRVEQWRDGEAAAFDLRRSYLPTLVRPDAWFVYRLDRRVMVGLVEYDRGTERGDARWKSKLSAYQALFASECLKTTTGFQNARILVITPDGRRRDHLASLIQECARGEIDARCWLADRSALAVPDLTRPLWRQPTEPALKPLVAPGWLTSGTSIVPPAPSR